MGVFRGAGVGGRGKRGAYGEGGVAGGWPPNCQSNSNTKMLHAKMKRVAARHHNTHNATAI